MSGDRTRSVLTRLSIRAKPGSCNLIDDPFTFDDPEWTFSWTVDGQIRLQ